MKTIKLSELERLITTTSNKQDGMRPLMLLSDTSSTYWSIKKIVSNIKDERRTYPLNSGDKVFLKAIGVLPRDRIIVDWCGLGSKEQMETLIGFSRDSSAQVVYLASNSDLNDLRWAKNHPEEDYKYHYDESLLENNFDMYTVVSSQE